MAATYGYCGVDEESWRLNEELNALGGGQARSTRMELIVLYKTLNHSTSILSPLETSIGLRDIYLPKATPEIRSMRHFPCRPLIMRQALEHPDQMELLDEVVHSVFNGFNRCLISFGERGIGKTRLLFGAESSALAAPNLDATGPACLIEALLQKVFIELSEKYDVTSSTVSLSAWAVQGNSIQDLCASKSKLQSGSVPTPGTSPNDFTLVDCPTLSIALEVLRTARRRCPGLLAGGRNSVMKEQDRAHFFLRVLVHQSTRQHRAGEGTAASVYLVDLLGTCATSGQDFNRLSEDDRIHRRITALHLQTFVKVLNQMRDLTVHAEKRSIFDDKNPIQITSARDSVLTAILCPILQGNVATTILAFVADDEARFTATKRTFVSLEPVPDISCACYASTDVRLHDLPIKGFNTVLPAPRTSTEALFDGDTSIDLEKLAYGDYPLSRGASDSEDRGAVGNRDSAYEYGEPATDEGDSRWERKLEELLGEFRGVMSSVQAKDASRVSELERRIDEEEADAQEEGEGRDYTSSFSRGGTFTGNMGDVSASSSSRGRDRYEMSTVDVDRESSSFQGRTTSPARAQQPEDSAGVAPKLSASVRFENIDDLVDYSTRRRRTASTEGMSGTATASTESIDVMLPVANKALLEEVGVLRGQKESLRTQLSQARDEVLEVSAEYEVRLQQQALEVSRLQALTRSLSGERDITEVHRNFEDEIVRLGRENESLRKQTATLKMKALASAEVNEDGEGGYGIRDSHVSFKSAITNRSVATTRAMQILKKDDREKEELRRQLDDYRKKERLFTVAVKLAEDLSKKLQLSHQKNVRLNTELSTLKETFTKKDRDLGALSEDTDVLRKSYAELRVERSRMLEELSNLRATVREEDAERKRREKLEKFAIKHGRRLEDPSVFAIPGLAGNSSAMYPRYEEKNASSPKIEFALSVLHSELARRVPTLLPLLRNLISEVYAEQAKSAAQKAKIVKLFYSGKK